MADYKRIGSVGTPDGREVHVEMDERGNVRATLVYDRDTPPRGLCYSAWAAMGSRAVSREQWNMVNKSRDVTNHDEQLADLMSLLAAIKADDVETLESISQELLSRYDPTGQNTKPTT